MDQEGEGTEVGVPTAGSRVLPGAVAQDLDRVCRLQSGSLFRPISKGGRIAATRLGDRSVALILKRTVGHAAFSAEEFSGHSLRAGLATSAALSGQPERDIMQQTRHKSEKVLRLYIRKGSLFQGNVVDALGF